MADTTYRDVVVRIALKQTKARLEAPDVAPAKAAIEKVDKAVERATNEIAGYSKEISKSYKQTAEAVEKVSKEQAELNKIHLEAVDNNIRVADSLKAAGEGAFTLARGLAFVSASTEEDFQQALKTIAKVQGAYDIFKGVVEVTRGVAEARKALMVATNAATTAEALHAVAINATTVSAKGATVALKGMYAAMGPVGLAILGVGGLVTAYAALTKAKESDIKASEAVITMSEKAVTAYHKEIDAINKRHAAEQRRARKVTSGGLAQIEGGVRRLQFLPEDQRGQAIQRLLAEGAALRQGMIAPTPPWPREIEFGGAIDPQEGTQYNQAMQQFLQQQNAVLEQQIELLTLAMDGLESQNRSTQGINTRMLEIVDRITDNEVQLQNLQGAL